VRDILGYRLLQTTKSNPQIHAVRACAKHGVHYVDITPEPHFVARIVKKCVFVILPLGLAQTDLKYLNAFDLLLVNSRYDYMAFKTNALIIPACGFDSIPPDVAVYVSNRYVKSVLGPTTSIEDSVTAYDVKGGLSGGSTGSIMSFAEDVPRKTLINSTKDYALCHRKLYATVLSPRLTFPACSPRTSQSPREACVQGPL
jgi:hypothetical protein